MNAAPRLRIARPTDDPRALLRFYRDGLGLEVIGGFQDHAGFDGVFLGRRGWPYHLAFTTHRGHPAGRAPTQENLLVFYVADAAECVEVVGFADHRRVVEHAAHHGARERVHIRDAKGNKDRLVPLPMATYRLLRRFWQRHRNPVLLFPNRHGGVPGARAASTPLDRGGVQNALRAVVESCGLKKTFRPTAFDTAMPRT